jgi:DNA-binding IscR family transcriptional regulator
MGPWSRSFVAAVAGNADNPELEVEALRINAGEIWAVVEGCEVAITAHVIPARIWAQMARYAQGMGQLEQAVEGRMQSVHLEHLLQEDWGELLIPRASQIAQACTCDESADCEHVAAVAYAFADEIERTPRVLLRWRGVADVTEEETAASTDPWQGKELSALAEARPMPRYAVLKRLGPSHLSVGGNDDLANALRAAYEALVSPSGS